MPFWSLNPNSNSNKFTVYSHQWHRVQLHHHGLFPRYKLFYCKYITNKLVNYDVGYLTTVFIRVIILQVRSAPNYC